MRNAVFGAGHPEGIVEVICVVEGVNADIFQVVREGLFRMQIQIRT